MRVRHPPAKPPRACDSSPAASRASPSRHFGPMRSLARNHTPTMTAPPRDQFFFFFCRRRRLRAIISTDRRPSVGVYLQNVVLSFIRNMYSIHNIVYTYTVVEPRWLDNIGWMSKNKEKKILVIEVPVYPCIECNDFFDFERFENDFWINRFLSFGFSF